MKTLRDLFEVERKVTRRELLKEAGAVGAAVGLSLAGSHLAPRGAAAQAKPGGTLNLWTWEGYAPDNLVNAFQQKTGVKLNVSYYSDNGELIAKLRAAGPAVPDLAQQTVNSIPTAMAFNLYQPLDAKRLRNYGGIYESLIKHSEEFGGVLQGKIYCVPHIWGSHAMMYNTQRIGKADSWGDVYNDAYKGRITYRATWHVFVTSGIWMGLGKQTTGKPMDDIFKDEPTAKPILDKILALLTEKKPLVKTYWTTQAENLQLMKSEEAWIAHGWDSTAIDLALAGYPIKYLAPKEGILQWMDTFNIPVGAKNIDAAYAWIDWMLEPKNAATLQDTSHYNTSVKDAAKYLKDEKYQKLLNEIWTKETLEKAWAYRIQPKWWTDMMAQYLTRLKAA